MSETQQERRTSPPRLRRQDGGYVAEGPGYFIWDEDPQEVFRAAVELAGGNVDLKGPARFLVLRDELLAV